MKRHYVTLNVIFIFCAFLSSEGVSAQLGFCSGNSGDPIFSETFGTGTNYGPALPVGTTNYDFIANSGPQDGQYTIGPSTFSFGWNLPNDHTPNDTNGKALIVNASFTAGEFYSTPISGLCENTTYEFSSWLINILPTSGCGGSGIPVNVKFEIWDISDTNLLASGDTGNIFSSNTPLWQQYALVFQTLPGDTAVILKMINNGIGGCGNDLAIDDIVFKSCGDFISIEDQANNNNINICSSQTPYSTTLTVTPDNSVFSTHFYQWQESADGITWTDMLGEITQSVSLSGINSTSYYRSKVAESASNLNNPLCNVTSDVFQVTVDPIPSAPTIECWETTTFNSTTCMWETTGTQPNQPTVVNCWDNFVFNTTTCIWENTGAQPTQPTVVNCWDNYIFNTITCAWNNIGELPIIETITSEGTSIVINTSNPGDFLYSLDGITFQSNNTFYNVDGGIYTIYIKVNGCSEVVTGEHLHFYIPKFFTPNNDGENDTFDLKGIENYNSSEVSIYDRFGKVLKTTKNTSFSWDGIYNKTPLPSTDYWYVVIIEGQRYVGHVTLKR